MSLQRCVLMMVLLCILGACGQIGAPHGEAPETLVIVPTSTMAVQQAAVGGGVSSGETVSYNTVRSLKEAVQGANLIVVGTITSMAGIFNGSLDTRDPTKAATDSYGIAQEYTFHVDQYLKGSDAPAITLVQVEGVLFMPVSQVTPALIAQARAADPRHPFVVGQRYLFFLQGPLPYVGRRDYAATAVPGVFRIAADGTVAADAPGEALSSLPTDFSAQLNAPLIPQIQQIVTEQQAGKP